MSDAMKHRPRGDSYFLKREGPRAAASLSFAKGLFFLASWQKTKRPNLATIGYLVRLARLSVAIHEDEPVFERYQVGWINNYTSTRQ